MHQYSPKLKKAVAEIKEILMKYDIAGIVTVHTPGFSEYINHISPTYSCASLDDLSGRLELRAKKEHFKNAIDRNNSLAGTANMFRMLSESVGGQALNLLQASEAVDRALGATHENGGHSSHMEQNN
jgi:hypothetical protein